MLLCNVLYVKTGYLPPRLMIISVPYLANARQSVSSCKNRVVPSIVCWIGGTGTGSSYDTLLVGTLKVGKYVSPSLTSESVSRDPDPLFKDICVFPFGEDKRRRLTSGEDGRSLAYKTTAFNSNMEL